MADFCPLVNQWFIAALGFCGTIGRNVLNWLVIVVDSEKGGSKNGSSRPVRKMADLCDLVNQWFIAGLGFLRDYTRKCSELACHCRGF